MGVSIAVGVVIVLFLLLLAALYFITWKNFVFEIENTEVRLLNRGGRLKIFVGGKLESDNYMPQIIFGEDFQINVNEKPFIVRCKSSNFGFKMRVEILQDGVVITDNGVVLKEKPQKEKKEDKKPQEKK